MIFQQKDLNDLKKAKTLLENPGILINTNRIYFTVMRVTSHEQQIRFKQISGTYLFY